MAEAETVDLPKRLPLIVEAENRGSSVAYDSRLVNCYAEKRRDGEYWLFQRPGLLEQSRPPAANATGRGVFFWRGNFYSIFGDKLYKDGAAVSGTVDTTAGVYRFDSCLGATPKLQLGNGVFAYNYDSGGGLVLVNDAQFPASFVKGWAYLDGTSYVMTPSAHLLGSDINDPVNWDPLNDILAQIEPDQGKALNKQLVYVVAFKEWTTEFFYDAGNATGSPLGRVDGAKVDWGGLSADSVREIGGALLWLGRARNGPPEVIYCEKLKAEAVSTKPIERLLEKADLTTVFSWTIKLDGHRFYVLTIKNENLTLAFDLEQRGDHAWSQWTDANGNYVPIVDSCANDSLQTLVQHESNGRVYLMGNEYATDDGDLIQVDIYTPNFDGGTRRRKYMPLLEMICDQQPGSAMSVRVNDHDFDPKKWSGWRMLDLSRKRPYITDCGTFVRRVHNFRHRRPVRMPRIQAVEMQLALGTL